MKKLIKNYISKPSQAIQLMIDGLRKQGERKDFEIDMRNFGMAKVIGHERVVCCGCAATCALQELAGINFNIANISTYISRANATDFTETEIISFEDAIDAVRRGYIEEFSKRICDLITVPRIELPVPEENWMLRSDDWEEQLPKVEAYVELLKSKGL